MLATFLLVACCTVFVPAAAWAAAPRDGNWWNTVTAPLKTAYAVGFLDGQAYAELMFQGAALYGMANPKTGKYDAARADTAAFTRCCAQCPSGTTALSSSVRGVFFGVTFGFISLYS